MEDTRKAGIRVPRGLIHNVVAMYGLYGSGYLLALITVPYLTRVLGPAGWGLVAFVQAFGGYLLLIVDFGFALSAPREIARHSDSREERAEVLAGVLGAKAVLIALCLAIALVVPHWITTFREHATLYWMGVFWALVQGCNLLWYFQGLERMRLAVVLDLAIKAFGVAGMFLVVRTPRDDWKIFGLQAVAGVLSFAVLMILAYREVPVRLPAVALVRRALRGSLTTFIPRNAVVLHSVSGAFILGLVAAPHIVGYYAAADRICRAIVGLLSPVSEALYPRMSQLAKRSHVEMRRLARLGLATIGSTGLVMGLVLFLCAPQLVSILAGKGYEPAVEVLRIFAILPPIVAFRNVLGLHWMLPLDLDNEFNIIALAAGFLNIGLAFLAAPHFAHRGVAWATITSQLLATIGIYAMLRWMRLDPLTPGVPDRENKVGYRVDYAVDRVME